MRYQTKCKLLTFSDKVKTVGVDNPVIGTMCNNEQQVPTYSKGKIQLFVFNFDDTNFPVYLLSSVKQ